MGKEFTHVLKTQHNSDNILQYMLCMKIKHLILDKLQTKQKQYRCKLIQIQAIGTNRKNIDYPKMHTTSSYKKNIYLE